MIEQIKKRLDVINEILVNSPVNSPKRIIYSKIFRMIFDLLDTVQQIEEEEEDQPNYKRNESWKIQNKKPKKKETSVWNKFTAKKQ